MITIIKNHKGKVSIEFPVSVNLEKSYFIVFITTVCFQHIENVRQWDTVRYSDVFQVLKIAKECSACWTIVYLDSSVGPFVNDSVLNVDVELKLGQPENFCHKLSNKHLILTWLK